MAKRKLSPEEVKAMGIDIKSLPVEPPPGEPGGAGFNPYAGGPRARQPQTPMQSEGALADMAVSWANEAPLGFGPQIQGAMGALAHATTQPFDPKASDLDAYRGTRDEALAQLSAAEKTRMGGIGEAVAPFTTPLPVKALPPGATTGARMAQGAKTGAAAGGMTALAHSKVDLTQPDIEGLERAGIETALGTLVGGGAGAAAGGLSRVPAKVGEGADELAKRAAMSSLGMSKADRGQLARSGKGPAAADMLLDETLGWTRGGTAEKTAAKINETGQAIGDIRKGIDAAAGGQTIDPQRIGDALRAEAARVGRSTPEAAAVADDLLRRAQMADAHNGGALIPLDEAERVFKSPLNEAARKSKVAVGEPPAAAQARELAHDATAKYNEEQAERIAQLLAPDLAGKYGDAKQRYAVAKELARILQKSEPEAFAKGGALEPLDIPDVSIDASGGTDGITGGVRTAIGKALSGVTLPAMAKGFKAAGGLLQKTPTGGAMAGREGERMSRSKLAEYFNAMKEADERRKK